MAVSTVKLNDVTLMTVNDTTAAAADVAAGEYFYAADGVKTEGSYVAPTPRTDSDVTVSGATVTIPSGAYASQVQKSVATGTAGTPTASKSSVSNHAVSVTPSVTNTTGYITGGTKTGTAVSVSAAELVSGTMSITENGTADVTNYASVDVNVSGGVDIPTFTMIWDDNWESYISVSCDKTFSECFALYSAGDGAAIGIDRTQSGTEEYRYTLSLTSGGSSLNDLKYTAYNTNGATFDFVYSPNGTITVVHPSEFSEVLNVTTNGTYYPDGKTFSEVNVNVPSTTISPLSVTANGTYTAPSGTAYSPVTVNVSGGGGGGSLSDQVRFYDYDGTLVNSYSASDFNALTAMPSNPSHTGLVAQGWNWSLADAKAYLASYPDGILNIGQMYTTDTGDTRLYIYIAEDTPDNRLTFFVRFTSSTANNVTIDWGDGVTEIEGSTTATNYSHTYATGGDYVIKLTVKTGTILFVGTSGTAGNSIFGSRGTVFSHNRSRIRKAEIGDNVTNIGTYVFYQCYSLASITIPSTVTSIGTYAFGYCYSLASITIPSGITSIGASTFYYGYPLASITIPSGITSIGGSAFGYCYPLASITIPSGITSIGASTFQSCSSLTSFIVPDGVTSISASTFQSCSSLTSFIVPDGVTSIGAYAFGYCYGISEYHFLPTTPPTLANTNAFTGIQSDCKIYVPQGCLEAYQTATNWSTYASYMVEESA